jgi:hypothetical protein
MLFIALATLNRLFVLKDYTTFNAINYKNYNQLNKSTTKL